MSSEDKNNNIEIETIEQFLKRGGDIEHVGDGVSNNSNVDYKKEFNSQFHPEYRKQKKYS